MKKTAWRDYETFTQRVFQAILTHEGVTNVDVRHDVELVGKTATHQIDVYWEFEQAGVLYRTVVSCKDWAARVKQGEIFTLKAVLDDLPGQPRGIVVSRAGFQEGAQTYARAHGIGLYELRVPDKGYVRNLGLDFEAVKAVLHEHEVLLDMPWMRSEAARLGLHAFRFTSEQSDKIVFTSENGTQVITGKLIMDQLFPFNGEDIGRRHRRRHTFNEPVFMDTGESMLPRAKVLAVEIDLEWVVYARTFVDYTLNEFVAFVLKNVVDGRLHRLDAEGRPLPPETGPVIVLPRS
ncbi:restriction endonuclease [Pendulispora rubella]|uniref:Restriction endonuclease n=1 Tax=Pendulispora rubella TaxID=2741070 RepID=A0ABZ2LP04_9BACT